MELQAGHFHTGADRTTQMRSAMVVPSPYPGTWHVGVSQHGLRWATIDPVPTHRVDDVLRAFGLDSEECSWHSYVGTGPARETNPEIDQMATSREFAIALREGEAWDTDPIRCLVDVGRRRG